MFGIRYIICMFHFVGLVFELKCLTPGMTDSGFDRPEIRNAKYLIANVNMIGKCCRVNAEYYIMNPGC